MTAIERPTKAFGIYHWDTFDNTTYLLSEADTQEEAEAYVAANCRVRDNGADRVDIVTRDGGDVVKIYKVG